MIRGFAINAQACMLLSVLLIESPRWLATHRSMTAAEHALRQLRSTDARLEGTLAEIAGLVAPPVSCEREPLLGQAGAGGEVQAQKPPVLVRPIILAIV